MLVDPKCLSGPRCELTKNREGGLFKNGEMDATIIHCHSR